MKQKHISEWAIVLGIISVFSLFRFFNLSWDGLTLQLHSDELFISQVALSMRFFDNLNPNFWGYHGAVFYVLKLWSFSVSFITSNAWWSTTLKGVTLAGRYLSAIFSTISLVLLYWIGKRLFGKRTGILTLLLAGTSVFFIQTAHFHVTENYLLLFELLIISSCISYWQKPSARHVALLSLWFALSVATTKNTAFLFAFLPVAAILGKGGTSWKDKGITLGFFTAFSLAFMFLFTPFTFINLGAFIAYSKRLAMDVNGTLLYGWSLQFKDTSALFWVPTVCFALGVQVVIPSVLASLWFLVTALRKKRITLEAILAVFFIGYAVYLGGAFIKFVRYLMPLTPMVYIFAGYTYDELSTRVGKIGKIGTIIAVAVGFLWAVAYMNVYVHQNPALISSDYITKTIPTGSRVIREQNNILLPLTGAGNINVTDYDFYTPDTREKMLDLVHTLWMADYFIVSSRRVYGTTMRLKTIFPQTGAMYKLLFDGNLGYEKVAEFVNYPALGPFVINDDSSEETFAVFDHPHVIIYKNTKTLTEEKLQQLLVK